MNPAPCAPRPWTRSPFRRLLSAEGLCLFGEFAQLAGLAAAALAILHRASRWPEVLLAEGLAQALLLPAGGMAVDAFGPRPVAAAAAAGQTVLAAGMAILLAGRGPGAPAVFAYAALLGACLAFALPAYSAAVTSAVPAAEVRSANGLLQAADNAARFAGPAAAALLLRRAASGPFVLAAAAWGLAAAAAVGLPGRRRGALGAPEEAPGPGGGGVGIAAAALRRDPVLLALLPVVGIFALGYAGATYAGLQPLAARTLGAGAAGPGVLYAAVGAGALAGALAVAARRSLTRPGLFAGGCAAAAGLAMGAAAGAPSLPLAAAALAASGVAFSACFVVTFSVIQTRTPEAVRGRALALVILGYFGVYPLAYGLSALGAGPLGARGLVAAGAALMVLSGAMALGRPVLRSATGA